MSEITMDQGNLTDGEEKLHTVQEDCHFKSRDEADKFDLATDDGNIDFNISGIPDEAVKRSENFNSSIDSVNHKSPTARSRSE